MGMDQLLLLLSAHSLGRKQGRAAGNMVEKPVHCILGGSCMLRAAGRLRCKCAFECMHCNSSLLLYLMRTKNRL